MNRSEQEYHDQQLDEAVELDDEEPEELECLGHDSVACGDHDGYPRTIYCDGSCRRWERR